MLCAFVLQLLLLFLPVSMKDCAPLENIAVSYDVHVGQYVRRDQGGGEENRIHAATLDHANECLDRNGSVNPVPAQTTTFTVSLLGVRPPPPPPFNAKRQRSLPLLVTLT